MPLPTTARTFAVLALAFLGAGLLRADGTTPAAFSFAVPSGWQSVSTQDAPLVRIGQWTLPDGAEAVVYRFGAGQPDDPQVSLNRWASTFTASQGTPAPADISLRRIGPLSVSQVELYGTYLPPDSPAPGFPPVPLAGWGLVGAVIDLPGGPLYARLTGPAAAVRRQLASFSRFVDSARPPAAQP